MPHPWPSDSSIGNNDAYCFFVFFKGTQQALIKPIRRLDKIVTEIFSSSEGTLSTPRGHGRDLDG